MIQAGFRIDDIKKLTLYQLRILQSEEHELGGIVRGRTIQQVKARQAEIEEKKRERDAK